MNSGPRPKPTVPPQDFSGPAGFAKAIRGLAHVPKKDVDEAISKEKSAKGKVTKRH